MSANATAVAFAGQYYWIPDNYYILSLLTGGAVILATVISLFRKDQDFPHKGGLPIIGSWTFFTKRELFINDGLHRLGKIFSFNVLNHKVVIVTGEEERRTFFDHTGLSLTEGYRVLFGGTPHLKAISVDTQKNGDINWFRKRVTSILRKDRLETTVPLMIQDLDRVMERWGSSGSFNPFDDIYNLVFQLTIRAASCREIADDPAAVKRVTQLYWNMEKGATPSSVLLPWLPSKAHKLRTQSMQQLYMMLKGVVDDRKATGRSEHDAMQALIDEGDTINDIVQFVMRALFAGITNTGIMSSWMTLFLLANPEWKERATAEICAFVSKYAAPGLPLAVQLAQLPPAVWDEELHVLDVCLQETIRLIATGTLLRRLLDGDLSFAGRPVAPGTFVGMPITDTHLNPEIYTEPHKWDPDRFAREEDKKEHWAYLGWGVGRHPCLGMRFAKIEVKAILALFLTRFECTLVDAAGASVEELPPPDRNNLYQVPPSRSIYVKYTRVSD